MFEALSQFTLIPEEVAIRLKRDPKSRAKKIGKVYGHLEVLWEANVSNARRTFFVCKCVCGQMVLVSGHRLTPAQEKLFSCGMSCGCKSSESLSNRVDESLQRRVQKANQNPQTTVVKTPDDKASASDWVFNCSVHGDYQSSYDVTISSKRGCPTCARNNTYERGKFYILSLWCEDIPVALKVGVTGQEVSTRVAQIQSKTRLRVQLEDYIAFSNRYSAFCIETEIKRELEMGVLSQSELPDGFSETTYLKNLEYLKNKIKEI